MKLKIKYFLFIILIISVINQSSNICIRGGNCPINSGFCNLDICECFPGYQTLITQNINPIFCNYKQYSKWLAFFLELFFPSIGLFYLRRFVHGFIKLILFIIPLILGANKASVISLLLFTCIYIMDLVGIFLKIYEDGNGVPLY